MRKSQKQSTTKKLTRSQRRTQQKRQKQMQNIGLMTIGLVTIVVALIVATNTKVSSAPEIIPAPARDHPMAEGNAMGDPNAPVVMIDFSDYQCSHCQNFYEETELYIIENYVATGKVKFVFRSFGDSFAGDSGRAAQASYCAGDQGKFWDMHDIIYSNFSGSDNGGYSVNRLIAMAEMINLDVEEFTDCLKDKVYADRVDEDRVEADEKGITGTPTFFINDQIVIGNKPISTFIQIIDTELAKVEE
jgi:protein-disulfide isomerase